MQGNTQNVIKRAVDLGLTVLLLCLMAYQVTGEVLHEWIGIGMTVLVLVHQVLNRKWYGSIFKGKYNPYRILTLLTDVALLAAFGMTAFFGMAMSGHAVPFLYGMVKVSFARKMHLAMSYWAFLLMGIHLGLHVPVIFAKLKLSDRMKLIASVVFCGLAGAGLYLFLKNGTPDYLFFRTHFAFLDYEKAGVLVFLENILMLVFWAFIGTQLAAICKNVRRKKEEKKNPLLPVVFILAAILIGGGIHMIADGNKKQNFGGAAWSPANEAVETTVAKNNTTEDPAPTGTQSSAERTSPAESASGAVNQADPAEIQDQYILIQGGTFAMGSPESENWRIDDEVQHQVTVSPFYIDAFETTQEEYERLMGTNPSTFGGARLPVENISWLDAVLFANAKSTAAGLTPVYSVTSEGVSWDRGANGYRLPTEAEWEYACRAGTSTPFNSEKSLDATEANFYGHYPYEIEENYFDDSVLEARPGQYRQTTIDVGSFAPNAWGLYDCHGNVNEWCWDFYGAYDWDAGTDPTGAAQGTRHVYRGGGWNDFAKNMRSAYRAAGQADMASYNLGVRLVRNATNDRSGIVTAREAASETPTGGKILIAYFSWSGNTRGIAKEIQRQTGADIFEISPVKAYSSDYSTVLMEAQEDQHNQARPELTGHVANMDEYDTILLGYPNWWASIPMPIASFLEEYDFSGKKILPFCSHGGGRFGQSLTAIAKLAPNADMGDGLSVHYSGGSTLSDDIATWLEQNGIKK